VTLLAVSFTFLVTTLPRFIMPKISAKFDVCGQTDRQTDKQTDTLIAILISPTEGGITSVSEAL